MFFSKSLKNTENDIPQVVIQSPQASSTNTTEESMPKAEGIDQAFPS